MKKTIIILIVIALHLCLVSCNPYAETDVVRMDNGKYEVRTYIWSPIQEGSDIVASKHTWLDEAVTIEQLPATVKEHKKWSKDVLKIIDSVDCSIYDGR